MTQYKYPEETKKPKKRISSALLIAANVLGLLTLFFLFQTITNNPQAAASNELSLGDSARVKSSLNIELQRPVDLNWKMKADVLAMRKSEVAKHTDLLRGSYEPSNKVFAAIEDRKPWWGTAGAAVFGSGDKSITGPSEESRFIMNPFLLVAANSATLMIWDPKELTANDLKDPDFPYFWAPSSLVFEPQYYRAIATYNVSKWINEVANSGKMSRPFIASKFSLVAYNARDFNYNYIYFDEKESIDILNERPGRDAVAIRQMIHCGGTCGYPGGCNNMSPFTPEIDRLAMRRLPARAVVKLWKEMPATVEQRPDFTMIINLI